jgi:hypothetical protein
VPDPRPSRHTPVRSRTQDRDATARLGLREASAEARRPTDRQVPRCRRERSRARPNRFTRACSVVRFRPSRAAAPQVCGEPHQHRGRRRQHRRGCRSRRQPRARYWRSEDPESCASRTNVTGGRRPTGGAVGPRASTVAPGGSVLGIVGMARSPCPLRGSARHVPASGDRLSGAQPVAAAGERQGGEARAGETCPRAHAQGLVDCPFLGTEPADCGRWGGPSAKKRAKSQLIPLSF